MLIKLCALDKDHARCASHSQKLIWYALKSKERERDESNSKRVQNERDFAIKVIIMQINSNLSLNAE